MNLNNQFRSFFREHFGSPDHCRCLLAVSGGLDSMAMLDVFIRNGITVGVAHCNFSLRGTESDLDNQLVKEYCTRHGISFFEKRFDTALVAEELGTSIQVTARTLRYEWFDELASANNYRFIATAHHRDDNAETILLNMVRGTGLQGIAGIPIINNMIIRPLIFASGEQLKAYVHEHNIPFREDASNAEPKYARNRIRHHVIPQLLSINPRAVEHINTLGEHARTVSSILHAHMQQIRERYTVSKNENVVLHINEIRNEEHHAFYVYELLKPFGFNASQVKQLLASSSAPGPGSFFYAEHYRALIDRESIIVSPVERAQAFAGICISENTDQRFVSGSDTFVLEYLPAIPAPVFQKDHLYLDKDKLLFPLTIDHWQTGDHFIPLGMKGKKKISDLLIDAKVNLIEKEKTLVLRSGDTIAAVLGHRIAEPYKITPSTNTILHIYKSI
jgi:tRNA(Ile)-lysidine synthase